MCAHPFVLVVLLYGGWGLESQPNTFSQFVQAVHEIKQETSGVQEKGSAWVFDFLRVLGDSIEDIDAVVKFMPYKLVTKSCQIIC